MLYWDRLSVIVLLKYDMLLLVFSYTLAETDADYLDDFIQNNNSWFGHISRSSGLANVV